MRLYVVQHGEALAEEVDPARPLSERGRADVQRLTAFLAERGVGAARIVHSGKTRARQTAEALADGITAPIEEIEGLGPNDPTDDLARRASLWAGDTVIVGHLPFLGRFVACACGGKARDGIVAYRPGSLVCLERAENGVFRIAWMVRPELL